MRISHDIMEADSWGSENGPQIDGRLQYFKDAKAMSTEKWLEGRLSISIEAFKHLPRGNTRKNLCDDKILDDE